MFRCNTGTSSGDIATTKCICKTYLIAKEQNHNIMNTNAPIKYVKQSSNENSQENLISNQDINVTNNTKVILFHGKSEIKLQNLLNQHSSIKFSGIRNQKIPSRSDFQQIAFRIQIKFQCLQQLAKSSLTKVSNGRFALDRFFTVSFLNSEREFDDRDFSLKMKS